MKTSVRTATSVAKVSYWYIPGGCDYVNAQAREAFFDDMDEAKRFEEQNHYPPELALLIPL